VVAPLLGQFLVHVTKKQESAHVSPVTLVQNVIVVNQVIMDTLIVRDVIATVKDRLVIHVTQHMVNALVNQFTLVGSVTCVYQDSMVSLVVGDVHVTQRERNPMVILDMVTVAQAEM